MAVLLNILISGVLVGGVYALFSVGLSLLLGVMRVFDIAHGAVLTIAALCTIAIARETGWDMPVLVLIGTAIGAVLGIPLEVLAIRPFRRLGLMREDMEHATMLATLALVFIAHDLMVHYTDAQIFTLPYGSFPTDVITIGGIGYSVVSFINFAVAVGLIGGLAYVVRATKAGRAIRAIASDHRSARLLGIDVGKYSMGVSIVACALAGLAGVLLSIVFNSVTWDFGDRFLFQAFIVVVIGGIGSIGGTLVAAIALAVIQGLVAYYVGGEWSDAVALAALMLFLVVRPQGLFGRVEVMRA
jgi:branched-chain amino acid transport system permease protein